MRRIYLWPDFGDKPDDHGDGGVRRVVEAQRRYLPEYGWEVVSRPEDADVLAAHMVAPDELTKRNLDKPLAVHNHGLYWSEFEWAGWALHDNQLLLQAIRAADAVTAPTEWVAQAIRRGTSRRVEVIPHGVDIDEWHGAYDDGQDAYVLWNKTRVDPVCDPQALFELARRLPGVRFIATIDKGTANAPENIDFVGRQGYAESKALVLGAAVYLATPRETFGIGTLEAMAAGVPVVGFDHGGNRDILTPGQDSYLAVPGDFDSLTHGIRWAFQHRTIAGQWARKKAAEYPWQEAIQRYADLYDRLADEASIRRQKVAPRTTIVVTAYNLARFLPDALASVQTQSDTDWECLVVDDASPDECGAIAQGFADHDARFRVIHNPVNLYLAESRNVAIRQAHGRYVLPLDADDMLAPIAVQTLADQMDAHRDLEIAYGGVRFLDEAGRPIAYGSGRRPGESGWPVPFDLNLMLRGPGQPMPYASMFRRRAWEATGGYRRRVRSSEDCDLWLRLSSYGFRAEMVTEAQLLAYRVRPDSMSQTVGWADGDNRRWFPWTRPGREALLPPAAVDKPKGYPSYDPPRVAVIIPVGPGHEHLVKDAVDSVEAQTFRGWECIVVADCVELPELPAWVKRLETPMPAGVAGARNLAIEASRAPFFICLDADDYLEPRAIEALLAAEDAHLKDDDQSAIIYPDFWEDPETPGVFKPYTFADADPRLLLKKALHSVTALTPRLFWETVEGYDGSAPWEDWDFQLKCAAAGFCSQHLALPLFTYRKHTGQRRNDRAARREQAEADMLERWRPYVTGGKELMACTSCSRTRPSAATLQAARAATQPVSGTDAVLLRFNSDARGDAQFVGKATGTRYMFAGGQSRWVLAKDAAGFLLREDFERLDPADLPARAGAPERELDAPGPPVKIGAVEEMARPIRQISEPATYRPPTAAPRQFEDEPREDQRAPLAEPPIVKTLADLPPDAGAGMTA